MSAWIPAKEHIDAMVRIIADTDEYNTFAKGVFEGYYEGQPKLDSLNDVQSTVIKNIIGQALTDEVILSVSNRYPRDGMLELPGARPAWWGERYEYDETTRMPTYTEALKIFDCYDYQACEHESYENSVVGKLVELIRNDLADANFDMRTTDAYNDAPWGWTSEQKQAKKVTICVDCGSTKGTKEVRA